MSKKPAKRRPSRVGAPAESRRAETATVGWMLAVATTLVCQLAYAGVRGYLWIADIDTSPLQALALLLALAATVIGAVSLALAWAAVRWRTVPPPRSVLNFSLVIGAAPLVGWLGLAMAALAARE